MRLGHLASDLARIANLIGMRAEKETLKGVMEEAKFFAEWAARDVQLEVQMSLAEIQGYIAQKELECGSLSNDGEWKENVTRRLRAWSDELLKKAGFLDSNERS